MRLTAFFKLYKICILLHRCNLKIFAKNRFEKSAIFVKIQQNFAIVTKNLQNFAKFQEFQLDNLVDIPDSQPRQRKWEREEWGQGLEESHRKVSRKVTGGPSLWGHTWKREEIVGWLKLDKSCTQTGPRSRKSLRIGPRAHQQVQEARQQCKSCSSVMQWDVIS